MGNELYELVIKSKEKNEEALVEIIKEFKPLIKKCSSKIKYDDVETELIMAIIKAVNSMPNSIRKENEIRAYICRCIINQYNQLIKKQINICNNEIELKLDILSKNDDDIEAKILIKDLIDKLSSLQRKIIKDEYFKGYSEAEIAEQLHVSRQSVNKTKNRALKKMRVYIDCEYLVLA